MEDLDTKIELPLLPSARILYKSNIRTVDSTANREDIRRGVVGISIDYESLSALAIAVIQVVTKSKPNSSPSPLSCSL